MRLKLPVVDQTENGAAAAANDGTNLMEIEK
jgi:hypothetical protein